MEKITRYFTHDYENDTTVEFVSTGLYTTLNCAWTCEDPDFGTETIRYSSGLDVTMEKIADEMLRKVHAYLNWKENKSSEIDGSIVVWLDEYGNSTLYAVEKALMKITGKAYNGYGHTLQILTIGDAAKVIKDTIAENINAEFAIGIGVDCRNVEDYVHDDDGLYWYGVKLIPNDENLFDGSGFYQDYIFMVGCYGGGNISMAYFCNESMSLNEWDGEELVKAMCESLDMSRDGKILLETIEKKNQEEK